MNIVLKKSDFISFVFFLIVIFIGLFDSKTYLSLMLSIFVYAYVGRIVERKSSIHMMFFLGYSVFIFLPSLLNWYYLKVDFNLFFLSSLASAFFLILTKNTLVKDFIDYGKHLKSIFILTVILSCTLVFFGLGTLVESLFALIIILMSLSFKQDDFKNNFIFLSLFVFLFLIYAIFSWSGFSRAVVLGWLLLALLQFCYSINIKINQYFFGLIPGLAAALIANRDIFNLEFSGFESSLNDSAYSPYRLASSFIEVFEQRGFDIMGFGDQILFTLLVFIPRSIWPEKPYAFGFEYTVRHLSVYLVDAGHSIASTLIGDHIYFLGYFGFVTSLIVISIIALATNTLYRIKGLNGNGVLIFSASMMILVWGGMTSFSARVALPAIIFLATFIIIRRFLIKRIRVVGVQYD